MSRRAEEEKSKSCCTWPKILVASVVLIVSGILIWQFAPIDDAINAILPTFNNTGSGSSGSGSPGASPGASPTSSPAEDERFQFMQCEDPTSPTCCNGLDNGICDLRVDQIMYATSHNANADFESGFLFSPNHRFKLEDSLVAGYRGINLDVCNCGGELTLCHGVCSFGLRGIVEVLQGINTFLNENPSEVLILPLELNSEVGRPVDIDELYGLMQEVPGFVEKIYNHGNITSDWPTLGELVQTNERVIILHYRGSSCDEVNQCPPGMHWYHRYAINTQFELPNLAAANALDNACTFARTPGALSKTFFGLNNFVSLPEQSIAQTMNDYQYLVDRIAACSSRNDDLEVNFVYVDHWSEGDLPRLVQDRNAAMATRRQLNVRRGS